MSIQHRGCGAQRVTRRGPACLVAEGVTAPRSSGHRGDLVLDWGAGAAEATPRHSPTLKRPPRRRSVSETRAFTGWSLGSAVLSFYYLFISLSNHFCKTVMLCSGMRGGEVWGRSHTSRTATSLLPVTCSRAAVNPGIGTPENPYRPQRPLPRGVQLGLALPLPRKAVLKTRLGAQRGPWEGSGGRGHGDVSIGNTCSRVEPGQTLFCFCVSLSVHSNSIWW